MSKRQSRTAELFGEVSLRETPGNRPEPWGEVVQNHISQLRDNIRKQEIESMLCHDIVAGLPKSWEPRSDIAEIRIKNKTFMELRERDKPTLVFLHQSQISLTPESKAHLERQIKSLEARRLEAFKSMKNNWAKTESFIARNRRYRP